ncbi:MAG: hypothetical protein FJX54_01920 [Alphaproteobacteria bacterium]|nr:hypothetical protein [Alphaproteobacteria bacterium]
MGGLFLALEQSGLGAAMRESSFLYPLANVLHIVGLVCFAGAIAIMDARLMGAFEALPLRSFVSRWRKVAMAAFAVQIVSGFMLFSAEASAIIDNPVFQLKLLLIAIGLGNVVVFELVTKPGIAGWQGGQPPMIAKISGAVSLLAWIAVAAAGRLIAYF